MTTRISESYTKFIANKIFGFISDYCNIRELHEIYRLILDEEWNCTEYFAIKFIVKVTTNK